MAVGCRRKYGTVRHNFFLEVQYACTVRQALRQTKIFLGGKSEIEGEIFLRQLLRLYGFETNHFCFAHAVCRSFIFVCCHNENFQSDCVRSHVHTLHEI